VQQSALQQLLRDVRLLELIARRNATGLLAGDYASAILGSGLVFHEARKYVPGEPARLIDWNITARAGEPYVRVHQEERQREIVVALDVSPSMHVGFQARTKLEYAVELAATLAVSAIEGGDRLGWVVFADRALETARPRPGRTQLFRGLKAMLAHTTPWQRRVEESDPRAAIHAIESQRGGRYVVFLISDFIDHDLPEDLRYLRARHDVSLLHVFDPLEYSARGPVAFEAVAPEGEPLPQRLWPGATGEGEKMEAFLRRVAGRHRIAVASLATTRPVPSALASFFHHKRRLQAGARG
jgi:uncharacterized protein (DUF58 family)